MAPSPHVQTTNTHTLAMVKLAVRDIFPGSLSKQFTKAHMQATHNMKQLDNLEMMEAGSDAASCGKSCSKRWLTFILLPRPPEYPKQWQKLNSGAALGGAA